MNKKARTYYDKKIEGFADVHDRVFERVVPQNVNGIKKIHLSGICGTAMGSLAVLLKQAGFEVSGSDTHCYPPMSDLISSLNINFKEGFLGSNIEGTDVVIVGNVCGADNKEAVHARKKNIPTLSLPEAIELFFLQNKKSITVSGTHGKTTTTGLLAHVLLNAQYDPGYMIGGVSQGNEGNARIGKGEYFVIEGDEYDTSYFDKSPKFLHYSPFISIITSLEFDHVDIYKDIKEYTEAFEFLVEEIPQEGCLFLYGDDEHVRVLSQKALCNFLYYGLNERNDITARDIEIGEKGQNFELVYKGESMGRFSIPMFGKHNLLNALSVCGVAIQIGISLQALRDGLENFPGMKRRQEVIFDEQITIIDDFAHHPTAVVETILAIKSKYQNRRLVAFFEPRSNTSRRKIFEEDYAQSFNEADLVFISTPEIKSNDTTSDFIDPMHIVNSLTEQGITAFSFKNAESLLEEALKHIHSGDVVLIMSNGSFDGIHQKLATAYRT